MGQYLVKEKLAFGLHALEKLDFLRFEANKIIRFAFSHGKTGINISNWQAVHDADVIHLHWINKGFVSLNGLGDLMGLGKKIVWTCHDMWPFTGVVIIPGAVITLCGIVAIVSI